MGMLTKSMERMQARIGTVYTQALQLKQAGLLDRMASPSMMSSPSDWQQQSKNRENYAMFRSWVYAAINALASEAASQPVSIGRTGESIEDYEEKRRAWRTKAHVLNRMTQNMRRKAANSELEVLVDHPLVELLDSPNPIQDRFQFVYSFVANLNLTGRAYVVLDEEDGREVYYSLPSTWIRPDHSEGPYKKFYVSNPRSLDYTPSGEPLDASQVLMAYLPNPADPMSCMSPASSQSAAIRVDDRIQTCQEKFFDNAPFPSVIVTIGKDPHPDVSGGVRPRLTATQRRQVVGAIRRIMGSVANYGNPAIVDGLIENITKFSQTQNELGWDKSEDKLKMRILSAFCTHPYIIGEAVGVGGYAQVYSIEKRFCSRVNIYLDMLSTLMTRAIKSRKPEEKRLGESRDNLLVWWEAKEPIDPSLDWSNWNAARGRGDVTKNELRAKLGLPPDEKEEPEIASAIMTPIAGVLTSVGMGSVQPDQASALFRGIGIPGELAERIAGVGLQTEQDQAQYDEALQQLQGAVAALRSPLNPKTLALEIQRQLT